MRQAIGIEVPVEVLLEKKYCRQCTSVFEIKTPVNSILWKVLWRAAVAFGSVDRKLYM
jgi:hypothetical protein